MDEKLLNNNFYTPKGNQTYFIREDGSRGYFNSLRNFIQEVQPNKLVMIFPSLPGVSEDIVDQANQMSLNGFDYDTAYRLSLIASHVRNNPGALPEELRPKFGYDLFHAKFRIDPHTGEAWETGESSINSWYTRQDVIDFANGKISGSARTRAPYRNARGKIPGMVENDKNKVGLLTNEIEQTLRSTGWQGEIVYLLVRMEELTSNFKEEFLRISRNLVGQLGLKGNLELALNLFKRDFLLLANQIRNLKANTLMLTEELGGVVNQQDVATILNYGPIIADLWDHIGNGTMIKSEIDDFPQWLALAHLISLSFEENNIHLEEDVFTREQWQELVINQFIHTMMYTVEIKRVNQDSMEELSAMHERIRSNRSILYSKVEPLITTIVETTKKSPMQLAIKNATGIDLEKPIKFDEES